VCLIYAELSGGSSVSSHDKQVLVCGRQTGHRLVYSSNTENQLNITVHASLSSSHPVYFLLEFDGLYLTISDVMHQASYSACLDQTFVLLRRPRRLGLRPP